MTSRPRWPRIVALIGVCLGLAGCGGSDEPPGPTATVATATGGAVAPAETGGGQGSAATQVMAGELVWTTAVEPGTNVPTNEVEEFNVAVPVIYAVVPISVAPAGATLTAAWTYNDTAIQGMDATVQLPAVGPEPIWIEFHLERQTGDDWPDGEYQITVREADRVVAAGSVDVVDE